MTDRTRAIYRVPWRVDIVTRTGVAAPLPEGAIADAVGLALDAGHSPRPASVTVVLTDDDELAELNREHMGHEGPTDVLSFPMLPPEVFDEGRARVASVGTGGRRRVHVGDVAVSVERAIAQAEEGRGGQSGDVLWSPADELRLLVTHGILHLCGWDHAEPDEERDMRALERGLLERDRRRP